MKKENLFELFKNKISSLGWALFIWGLGISQEEYWERIYQQEKIKLSTEKGVYNPPTKQGFENWYLDFRSEIAKSFGVNYSLSIASWTFSKNFRHYYEQGLSAKEAVLEYTASKNNSNK